MVWGVRGYGTETTKGGGVGGGIFSGKIHCEALDMGKIGAKWLF